MDHLPRTSNWRDALRDAFPALFPGRCTISCGRGWSGLLHTLCGELQRQTDQHGAPQVVVYEVKEKYGSLCFNTRGASLLQDALIVFAEVLSGQMCEVCGAPGIELTDTSGWVSIRCDTHRNNRPPDVVWFDLNHLNPHYTLGLEAYFAENPDARRRRHHALVDALAARAGYLHAIRIQAGR